MKAIKFAMIDDGVSAEVFYTPFVNLSICIYKNCINKDSKANAYSHGSICSAIYNRYLKHKDIEFISIKILDDTTHKGHLGDLITAIDWCIANRVNVVNVSLGTIEKSDFKELSEIVSKAIQHGMVFVAAMHNENQYSLPACLNGVIGVKSSLLYNDGNYKLRWYPFDGIEIVTSGVHMLERKDDTVYVTQNKNSYAAPVISAYLSDLLYENQDITNIDILKHLEKNARTVIGEHIPKFYPYVWEINTNEKMKSWDFNIYSDIIKKYLTDKDIVIDKPVICVTGLNRDINNRFINLFVHKLKDLYSYSTISEYVDEINKNHIIFPKDFDKYKFCGNVIKKYGSDLLIVHANNFNEADYRIEIYDHVHIYYKNTSNEYAELINETNLDKLQECVNILYDVLTS